MFVMLDTSKQEWAKAREELGMEHIEQLLTPLTRYSPHEPDSPFAIDNGAFSGFPEKSFFSLLERELPRRHLCRFATVPDVVGSARRTLELFDYYSPRMAGWPLAYVCQDGQENVSIPWPEIAAIFIGGSNSFKESQHAIDCIKVGKLMGKHVHVGRVNTAGRFEAFEQLGVDSIDGTGLARYSHMRESIKNRNSTQRLFTTGELVNV
jgi:hypothetical protein